MTGLVIEPPAGAVAQTPRPLRLDEVPGAEIAAHRQWAVDESVVSVACITRPVPLWIDGLMPAVIGGMNGLLRRHLALTVVHPEQMLRGDGHWAQAFDGESSGERLVVGRHLVGFARPNELLACTAACEGAHRPACVTALAELELTPGFVVREPTPVESALSAMLARPRATVLVGLVALLSFVVVLLARRPRSAAGR